MSQKRFSRMIRSWMSPARKPIRRARGLGVEGLEDRSVPSFSLPLQGTQWTELGPRNNAVQPSLAGQPGQGTNSPANLASSGRVTDVAPDLTHPGTFYLASAGGGVWKTTDNGDHWFPLTDRLPASTPVITPVAGQPATLPENLRTIAMGSVAVSPVDPNVIYAGEGEQNNSADSYPGNGVLRSLDGGKTWSLLTGPAGVGGTPAFEGTTIPRIVVVRNNAAPSGESVFVLAGTDVLSGGNSGVYRSDDRGATWTKISQLLNAPTSAGGNGVSPFLALSDMAVDPTNPNIAYVAVASTGGNVLNGIYSTTTALSNDPTGTGGGPATPWTIIFGGNGGPLTPSGTLIFRINFVVAPSSPSVLYVAVDGPSGTGTTTLPGLFRSTDGGITFRQLPDTTNGGTLTRPQFSPYAMAIAVDPTNASRVAIGSLDTTAAGFSGGIQYTENALATDSAGTPAPVTWSKVSIDGNNQGSHADTHTIAFGPPDATGRRELMVGGDGGLFRGTMTDAGNGKFTAALWESANGVIGPQALDTTQYVGIALHPTSPDESLGGTQDNGTIRFFDNGVTTASTLLDPATGKLTNVNVPEAYAAPTTDGGDGGQTIYDFIDPRVAYHIAPVGSFGTANFVQKSTDGGQTWSSIANGILDPNDTLFYPPFVMDPSMNKRLFVGSDVISETTDGGASWHKGPTNYPFLPTVTADDIPFVTGKTPVPPNVTAIGIGRSNPYIMYVAVNFQIGQNFFGGPAVFRINVRSSSHWTDVSPLLPPGAHAPGGDILPPVTGAPSDPYGNDISGGVTAIAVDPFDSNILYVTTTGHQVWRSTNGGTSWTLMNTTGLPGGDLQQDINSVVIDPNLLTVGGQKDDDIYVATDIGVYKLHDPTQPVATQTWVRVSPAAYPNDPGGAATDYQDTPGYFPDARVEQLAINTSTGILAAGTHGRGLWEIQIRPYISGTLFQDTNGDGTRQATEPGIPAPAGGNPNVVAIRLDAPGSPFQAAATSTEDDPNGARTGFYSFVALPNGQYRIQAADASAQLVDPNTTYDVTTPDVVGTIIDQQTTVRNGDIGVFKRVTLSGRVFNDRNGDGVQQANEPPLANWPLELFDSKDPNTVLATTTSNANGDYSFTGVGHLSTGGTLEVRDKVQPGYAPSVPAGGVQAVPAYTSGQNVPNLNFGNVVVGSLQILNWPNPATVTAGTPVAFTLVVEDQFGNPIPGYQGTVHFTSNDTGPSTILPADITFTGSENGVKQSGVMFTTAGLDTLNAISTTDVGLQSASKAITVTAGATTKLGLTLPPAVTAGIGVNVTVRSTDRYGNPTSYTGPVSFASSDSAATVPPGGNITNGAGTFAVAFRTAGTQTLTVTDPNKVLGSDTKSTVVSPYKADHLAITALPASVTAGSPANFLVTAFDMFGNRTSFTTDASGNPIPVVLTFGSSDGRAALPPPYGLVAGDGGQHGFTATFATAGTQTLSVSSPGVAGTSASIAVTPGTLANLSVSGYPSPVIVGTTAPVTVTATDFFGNPTSAAFTFTSDAAATFPAGTVVNGTGQFNVALNALGTHSIIATSGSVSGAQTGIVVVPVPPPPPPPPPPPGTVPPSTVVLPTVFAVGSDVGPLNFVQVFNADRTLRTQFQPFDPGFFGGVRVAVAGLPDGTFNVVAAPGPGLYQNVKVFDSADGHEIKEFPAFESDFTGGMFVSAADLNGDGVADYVISPDTGGGPRVTVINGADGSTMADFFGIEDPDFRGGARTALGDVNGDGTPDLIVAAGFGGGPRVAVFDGTTLRPGQKPQHLVGDFFVFEQGLRNGVYVAAGDLNGDGKAEVIAGAGPGGGPRVFALDGSALTQGKFSTVADFFAGDTNNRGGVRVTVKNLDGDGRADLVTGSAPGVPSRVTMYAGKTIAPGIAPPELGHLEDELGAFPDGVYVG